MEALQFILHHVDSRLPAIVVMLWVAELLILSSCLASERWLRLLVKKIDTFSQLFEQKPEALSLEMLSLLQASHISKLILVNDELIVRFRQLSALSRGSQGANPSYCTFLTSANEFGGLNLLLHEILASSIRNS